MPKCATTSRFSGLSGAVWNGWGPSAENTHFQPAEQAGVRAADVPRLTFRWAFGLPDVTSAWGQTTIAGGHLFVGTQNGDVYSLDAKTGCLIWTYAAEGASARQ